jgi:hypothetical protein
MRLCLVVLFSSVHPSPASSGISSQEGRTELNPFVKLEEVQCHLLSSDFPCPLRYTMLGFEKKRRAL